MSTSRVYHNRNFKRNNGHSAAKLRSWMDTVNYNYIPENQLENIVSIPHNPTVIYALEKQEIQMGGSERDNNKYIQKNQQENITSIPLNPILTYSLGRQWIQMGGSENSLAIALLNFCATAADRFANGYPTEILDSTNTAMIYNHPRLIGQKVNNVNNQTVWTAHPAFPVTVICDKYPSSVPFDKMNCSIEYFFGNISVLRRLCTRCHEEFNVDDDNNILNKENCLYHTGKRKFRALTADDICQGIAASQVWSCCNRASESRGCCIYKQHVWSGLTAGLNAPLKNYVQTQHVAHSRGKSNCHVYALDCEMSFTKDGLELTKVTVINIMGNVVYETFVQPDNPIVDYNTKFSGVSSKDMQGRHVKHLKDVQQDLLRFISAETVIIGHGLENDLRALKIIHEKVVDTALLYPHVKGYPLKNSLKVLSKGYLNQDIQKGCDGHNPREDAMAAMQLAVHQVMTDLPMGYYKF